MKLQMETMQSSVCCAIFGLIILSLHGNVSALNCFQCSGTDSDNPFQCNEWLSDYDLEPQSCDAVYDAKYCIKRTGRFEGGIGAKRFCSSLDLGNYCNYVRQPGDIMDYRSCVFTCTGDGCNAATSITSSFIFITILSIVLSSFL